MSASSGPVLSASFDSRLARGVERSAAWLLGLLWLAPLLYAFWAAFHPREFATRFDLTAPWTLANIVEVWNAVPFGRYYLNTVLLVSGILIAQLVIGCLAAYAFARFEFRGREVVFAFVLVQLMLIPDVLIVQNFRTMSQLGLVDTITAIGLPYVASAFCIFLLRQSFRSIPVELVEAAEVEGASRLQVLWKVYVPIARPTLVAFGLVSVSGNWNNFLWPLVITSSAETRPLTVGLAVFITPETGVNWTVLSAATVIVIAPLLAVFLLFQRQFVQSFLRSGIK